MPIDYKDYHPSWKQIRKAVLKRASDCCELCFVENYAVGWRLKSGQFIPLNSLDGRVVEHTYDKLYKRIKIILTIHHIDFDKNNNKHYNLILLCQRCHCKLNLPFIIKNRKKKKDVDLCNNLFYNDKKGK